MKGISGKEVSFQAAYDLSAPGSTVRSSLPDLANAAFLQLGLPTVVPNVRVNSGAVTVTVNGNHEATFRPQGAVVHNGTLIFELHGLAAQLLRER